MKLKAVARITPHINGFMVEAPTPMYQEYLRRHLGETLAKFGGVMEITIADPVETDNQVYMRLFHAVRDKFAIHHNEARDKVEADLIAEFGIKEGLKRRLKDKYGSINDKGELKSLAKYTRGDWIPLIRGVLNEALEQGIECQEEVLEYGARNYQWRNVK